MPRMVTIESMLRTLSDVRDELASIEVLMGGTVLGGQSNVLHQRLAMAAYWLGEVARLLPEQYQAHRDRLNDAIDRIRSTEYKLRYLGEASPPQRAGVQAALAEVYPPAGDPLLAAPATTIIAQAYEQGPSPCGNPPVYTITGLCVTTVYP